MRENENTGRMGSECSKGTSEIRGFTEGWSFFFCSPVFFVLIFEPERDGVRQAEL